MAKNAQGEIAALARRRSSGSDRLTVRKAFNQLQEVATDAAIASVADAAVYSQEKLKKLYDQTRDRTSKTHTATVDMSGSILGVLSFESLNWMVRYVGEKVDMIGNSVDYWQSIPHLVIGLATYWGELLSRKQSPKDGPPVWPSMPRLIASEWAKVFILLGLHNLVRALRVRRKDAKLAQDQLVAVQAELAKAREQLAALQAPAK